MAASPEWRGSNSQHNAGASLIAILLAVAICYLRPRRDPSRIGRWLMRRRLSDG
jgi:hypothetical protein